MAAWHVDHARLDGRTIQWTRLAGDERALTFAEVAHAWRTDGAFRGSWIESLRKLPFDAYCWECPPIDAASRNRPFECVFVSSPSLARMPPDAAAFAEHFASGCEAAAFANLGGDALLVAPCPEPGGDFAHLAGFTATASRPRQQALWKAVGDALVARNGAAPLWLSTSGHGIAWLHVRLDSSPKYYLHAPYGRRDMHAH